MGEDLEVVEMEVQIGGVTQLHILYPDTGLGTFICVTTFNFAKIL